MRRTPEGWRYLEPIAGALVVGGLAVVPAASADTEFSCDGTPATIVAQNPPGEHGLVTVEGTPGDDVVYVPSDTWYEIDAGDGSDVVCGYPDIVNGGIGNDTIEETFPDHGSPFDVHGDDGNDTITASADDTSNTFLRGGFGDDTISGGSGRDEVAGGAGNDTINGNVGDDQIYDDADHSTFADINTKDDGADHVDAGPGHDVVYLNSGDGTVGGDDVVDGGTGSDFVSYVNSHAGIEADLETQQVVGSAGAVDSYQDFESWFAGSMYADTILGAHGADWVIDYGGHDDIKTFGGNDHVDAANGTVDTGVGDDVFDADFFPAQGLVVRLGVGNDRAVGISGRGTYVGGPGDDRFLQVEPSDGDTMKATYRGGSGHDFMTMQNGRPLTFRSAEHVVRWTTPHHGRDLPNSVHYSDIEILRGGRANDRFYGSAGRQWFEGGAGDDRMRGGRGNDVLLGGTGRHDQAWGGPGRDRCRAEQRTACELG